MHTGKVFRSIHRRSLLVALWLLACGPIPGPGAADLAGSRLDSAARPLTSGPAKSGTRLRLRWVDGTDGSRTKMNTPERDSLLTASRGKAVNCQYTDRYVLAGHVYCLPTAPDLVEEPQPQMWFTDSACTKRLLLGSLTSVCEPAATWGFYYTAGPDGCGATWHVGELKEVAAPASYFRKTTAGCVGSGLGGPGLRYYEVQKEVPLTTFLEGTEGAE